MFSKISSIKVNAFKRYSVSASLNIEVDRMTTLFLIFACFAVASASYMKHDVKVADKEFMVKQKAIFEIFMNVWQPEIHNSYYELSQKFTFEGYKDKFNAEAYENFMHYYDFGFLGMHEIFAPFQTEHNEQMLALFKMFYFAKDWDTFYNFMVWARFHVNPGMFIQSLTMAILHRNDFTGFVLPPIYEITPYYFFNNYVISSAQQMKMQGVSKMEKTGDLYSYTFPMNYTNYYVETNHDSKLAYFMEGKVPRCFKGYY